MCRKKFDGDEEADQLLCLCDRRIGTMNGEEVCCGILEEERRRREEAGEEVEFIDVPLH